VVADSAAPALQRATLRQGVLEIELSTEPNQATAAAAIQLDGAPLAWTLGADRYTLTSTTHVPAGAHTLTVATSLTDLGGQALAVPFSQSFTAAAQDSQALFQAPDPNQVNASAVGNLFGFQGLPKDPETGLIYFRNRYYDPQLGRFITADPKGYTDGPSVYAFEMNDPANGSDPMGTVREEQAPDPNDQKAQKLQARYQKAYKEFKRTKTGAEAAKRLEDDPKLKLTIVYDPNYSKPGQAAVVEDYQLDPQTGRAVSATLRVGPNFDQKIEDSRYKYGSTLAAGSKPRQVYTVAHEEQGHFMNAATDPDYAKRIQRLDELSEEFRKAHEKAGEDHPGRTESAVRQKEFTALVPKLAEKSKERDTIHDTNETQADETAKPYVEEYKKQ
jgi:RHS repeat-associated protein